ncbi:MAG: hypothetical protein JWL88_589 [Parcubacteria group bacterium]|nr:hypothetical protein [Parcubacteria group bacterium]
MVKMDVKMDDGFSIELPIHKKGFLWSVGYDPDTPFQQVGGGWRDPHPVTSAGGSHRLDFTSRKSGTFPLILNYHCLGESSPENKTEEFEITVQ